MNLEKNLGAILEFLVLESHLVLIYHKSSKALKALCMGVMGVERTHKCAYRIPGYHIRIIYGKLGNHRKIIHGSWRWSPKEVNPGIQTKFLYIFLHTIDWNIMRESTLPTFFLNIKLTVVLFDVERVNDQHERRTFPHEK